MNTCAYVTFADPDDLDDERDPALAAWREHGIEGRAVRWDDPDVDWSAFDAAVVRSVWDYTDRRADFLAWARRAEAVTRLLNPADVLERNTDKTYLRDLGVPIVPTHWSSHDLPDWEEFVVKPAVSAGARDTIRTTEAATAQAHAAALEAAGRTPMVQPYLDMVESEGETSLLYFNRRLSHAVRRSPMLAQGMTSADNARAQLRDPAPDQVELAEKVLAAIPQALLYARVDLVRLPDGRPAIIELELTEPYLYLSHTPQAAKNLAAALGELL
ncbi:RimK family alpha-L-glutamate ligase [Nonomuraea endophytica]|uniref:RimK family alpha-L-glutamate ligase n=1 Tax=Nonomuraea endophytica TaxID=714136 RepID=UPI0037C82868